MSSNQ